MIEILLILFLSFGSGYGTRYFTEPEVICKNIEYEIPKDLQSQLEFGYCKAGIDPSTGIDHQCYITVPTTYVFTDENYDRVGEFTNRLQLNLFQCKDLIDSYNKDKSIIK